MKWSDIKNVLVKKIHTEIDSSPTSLGGQKSKKPFPWKWVVIGIIILGIGIGAVLLFKFLNKTNSQPVLPAEELQAIGTFLDENPPQPLEIIEADLVEKTLSQPVSFDESDVAALKNFFNR